MGTAIAQWLESSSHSLPRWCGNVIARDPLLLFGGVVVAIAFLWPVLFWAVLVVTYGSQILT